MNAIKIEDVSYTIKDIFALPQGQRAELINGDMYMMAPPKLKHQRLLSKLNTIIIVNDINKFTL
ncbi:MAG: hypothetical protein J6N53_02915 [Lachnospiraceae bacterium]|nr:hypothetical protein [Lachnospiraceae bacterium]MBO6297773.1 hypothetical protein [Lachnospiraceae bacterium]MBP3295169.1 hypothetical protein [Lachnospiraceae bacterium]